MLTASSGFATAVEGGGEVIREQKVSIAFPVTLPSGWDADLSVESVQIEGQTVSSLPDTTSLIAGYTAVTATVVLSGLLDITDETKTIFWLLNPWNAASPMFRVQRSGIPVTVDVGVYPTPITGSGAELLRKFTGYLDTVTVDDTGTVTIKCIDGRTNFRTVPPIRSVVGANRWAPPGIAPQLTALWPLDQIARASGYDSCPRPDASTVLFASLHGSASPEILAGTLLTTVPSSLNPAAPWAQGRWGAQCAAAPLLTISLPAGRFNLGSGGRVYAEFAGRDATIALDTPGVAGVSIGAGSTTNPLTGAVTWFPTVQIRRPAFAVTVTGSGTAAQTPDVGVPPYLAAQVVFRTATTATVTLWCEGVSVVIPVTGLPAASTAGAETLNVAASTVLEAVKLQPTGSPTIGFVPRAVLDGSLNDLLYVPDVAGNDAWATMQAIAAAELGVVHLDEDNVLRFTNRTRIATTSARVVSSTKSLRSFGADITAAALANHITVPINTAALQAPSWVWAASDTVGLTPGLTNTWIVTLAHPTVAISPDTGSVDLSFSTTTTSWRAAVNEDGSGGTVTHGVSIGVTQLSPTAIVVTATNTNPYTIWLVVPGTPSVDPGVGAPAVYVGGQFILTDDTGGTVLADAQWPPAAEGGAASSPAGDRPLAVPASVWIQSPTVAQGIADDLLISLYRERPTLEQISIEPDPRLQLTDRVTLLDPDVSGMNDDVLITRSRLTLAADGWSQDIDARALWPPGAWVLGQPGRSELGVDTIM